AFAELVGGWEQARQIGRTTMTWYIGPCECGKGAGSNPGCGGSSTPPPPPPASPPPPPPSNPAPPSNGYCAKSYTIRSGDTCYNLARANGMDDRALQALNSGINCLNLQINQVICVAGGGGGSTPPPPPPPPSAPPAPAPPSPPSTNPASGCSLSYTVKGGDYCFKIAEDNKLNLAGLQALNPGVVCENLPVGSVLCVAGQSGGSPSPPPPPPPPPAPNSPPPPPPVTGLCTKSYTIQSGDTCYKIAGNNGMSVEALIALNGGINCNFLTISAAICVAGGGGGGALPPVQSSPSGTLVTLPPRQGGFCKTGKVWRVCSEDKKGYFECSWNDSFKGFTSCGGGKLCSMNNANNLHGGVTCANSGAY
ncbi:hypothetical protein HDU67_002009, partial [Dinochytrium kinnereticum]